MTKLLWRLKTLRVLVMTATMVFGLATFKMAINNLSGDLVEFETNTSVLHHSSTENGELTQLNRRQRMTAECRASVTGSVIAMSNMTRRRPVEDHIYMKATKNCRQFVQERGYHLTGPPSEAEKNYPLAYIITAHKNAEQVERLLRIIYQPQNVYCIHYDAKSNVSFQEALRSVASCFNNVFIASRLERVVYASFSRLKADINCMQDLVHSQVHWKYLINLAGQEFPLKTNMFMVDFFKALPDNTGIGITSIVPQNEGRYKRFQWVFKIPEQENRPDPSKILKPVITTQRKSSPPENITVYSGSAYNYFSRQFVDYVLKDTLAITILNWMNDTYSPDENYWATLVRLPASPDRRPKDGWAPRYRASKWQKLKDHPPCMGFSQRESCVYGIGDLPWLVNHPALFANKFDIAFDENVVDCLEQWLIEKARKERLSA